MTILFQSIRKLLRGAAHGEIFIIKGEAGWHRSTFKMQVCDGRDQVARSAATGWAVFEAPMPQLFAKAVLDAGKGSIIDVGANTGFYTLLATAVSRKVTVTAYEPMNEVRAILTSNLKLAPGRSRVSIRPNAISSTSGICTLFVPDGSHGLVETSASLLREFKGGSGYTCDVQALTLDSAHINERKVAVIKIDAEGHDLDVLIGAQQILMRHRPVVFLEVLLGADEAALTQILQRCRYVDVALTGDGAFVQRDTVRHHTDAWNHMWLPSDTAGATAA